MREKSNKIPTLSKFSHELKTPIHGILGITDFLKNNWNSVSVDKRKECLDSITEASNDMLGIINLILDPKNKDNIHFDFKEVDALAITEKIIQKFIHLRPESNKINLTQPTGLKQTVVSGDEFWIGQVILNIISNAYNHGNGGVIEVILDNKTVGSQEYFCITVKDRGPGINADNIDAIFEPFHVGKDTNENSTGLGLSICKEVIENHKGTISARNNKTQGLSVEIELPISKTM